MRLSLVIPSYGRPLDLKRCLAALRSQALPGLEILCVCRQGDVATQREVESAFAADPRVREVTVLEPGLVAAMNAGLRAANQESEFVTFTDDDTEAPPDWLSIVVAHFDSHPECGAVGGQDRLQLDLPGLKNPPVADKVGVYTWSGGFHATHHCPIREDFVRCHVLKGVNMTYRHELIRDFVIGQGLGGEGAQVGSEASLAARVRSRARELHFLRDAWVIHHASPRGYQDDRLDMETDFARQTTRNQAYVVTRYLPWPVALASSLRQILVGSRFVPGLLRLPFLPGKWHLTLRHFPFLISGIYDGLKDRLFSPP